MGLHDWALKWIKGTVSSSLRGGDMGKSTLAHIEGAKRRVELYGVDEAKIREAIAAGIDQSPNRNSAEAEELRKRYLQ